mgnify:CR=1 FL=1
MSFHHQCTGTEKIEGFNEFIPLLTIFIGPAQFESALEYTEHRRTEVFSLEDHVTGMDTVHLNLLSKDTNGVEGIHRETVRDDQTIRLLPVTGQIRSRSALPPE